MKILIGIIVIIIGIWLYSLVKVSSKCSRAEEQKDLEDVASRILDKEQNKN